MSASGDHPYPPLELAERVCSLAGRGEPFAAYESLGAGTRASLEGLLPDGWSFEGKRVLDFGCGAGRTLRHFLPEAERAELWGADIDAPSIEWLERTLCPPLHALCSQVDPPLGLEHGSFDLIWALSVFTHLTDNSLPWLLELHRLLKPGGLLVATYMGRWGSEVLAGEPWVEDRIGMNVLRHDNDWALGGPMVLMSDWWMRAHWGRAFEILAVEPQIHNQSWALMRRRELELTVEDLEAPADDPREYLALRHNVRQLQRELEERRRKIEQANDERPVRWTTARARRVAHRLAGSLRVRRSD